MGSDNFMSHLTRWNLAFVVASMLFSGTCASAQTDAGAVNGLNKMACTTNVRTSDITNALYKASQLAQKMSQADVNRLREEVVDETDKELSRDVKAELESYIRCNEIFKHAFGELETVKPEAQKWTQLGQANDIIKKIQENSQGKDGTIEWQEITQAQAQDLANSGVVVEGVLFNPSGHGHLATVAPVPRGIGQIDRGGPYVTDGNPHVGPMLDKSHLKTRKVRRLGDGDDAPDLVERQLFPGGIISVRRSFGPSALDSKPPKVHWYKWLPSTPNPLTAALEACDDRPQKLPQYRQASSHGPGLLTLTLVGVGVAGAVGAAAEATQQSQNQSSQSGGCVTLPIACTVSSQCACGGSCADFGGTGICQPK
jgi:hypothetical protein